MRVAISTSVASEFPAIARRRLDAHLAADGNAKKSDHDKRVKEIELFEKMDREENAVIISGNFAALHHVRAGDFVTLQSSKEQIKFRVVGTIED